MPYDPSKGGLSYDPTKGMPNHYAGTSPFGPIIGTIAHIGINSVARIWLEGKQTRITGKNNGFNIF